MGTFLGQALKSRQGDQDWLNFFAVTSSAFAHMEDCVPVPRFSNLSKQATFEAVANAESNLRALEKMAGFSAAMKEIAQDQGAGKGSSYHLIVLNSLEKTVDIIPYSRESLAQAVEQYAVVEAQAAGGQKIEPVLVSAGPINKLRNAYPNFFLDINEFRLTVKKIIEKPK